MTIKEQSQLLFYTTASAKYQPDLELYSNVILDTIPLKELFKTNHITYPLTYHTGDTTVKSNDNSAIIILPDDEVDHLPTINTKNPIIFSADIEIEPLNVIETIDVLIPGTNKKLIINIDTTRKNCLLDMALAPFDASKGDTLIHVDNFDDKNSLLTAIYLDTDKPADIFKKTL